ncbi:hypothetical protein Q3V38_08405 [Limosilactobacillus fermentum]|uniref:hypothetical protein n=1 Tax=Limosilactobacillus fermentum TaxID=1613 RepID=UPI00062DC23B|nr:hypothetical protein [Limosilactobacillus fermentum]KLD54774.1 hypothetical protein WU68_05770 [Limosilactobacillus fermentum]KPH23099.1 hypothetical protein AOT41_04020 [Limosilactobacillus fermentum]WLF74827.1 hypothetical protein Q3V38_08405 [Limosilactobacillus fermentum]
MLNEKLQAKHNENVNNLKIVEGNLIAITNDVSGLIKQAGSMLLDDQLKEISAINKQLARVWTLVTLYGVNESKIHNEEED